MNINLKQAIKLFYSKSSFDMIYQEAIANALDANATTIQIIFTAKSLSAVETINLSIKDNGVGFTDERYEKFCKLMEIDEQDNAHRGLGRLVYLFYFENVKIKSHFNQKKFREFEFDKDFGGTNNKAIETEDTPSGSILNMSGYSLTKLKEKNFADVEWIRKSILKKFYSQLYSAKKNDKRIIITINSNIGNKTCSSTIDSNSLPEFNEVKFVSPYSLDGEMILLYSIKECDTNESSVITALSIDGRNETIDVFAEESIPQGYEMVFMLLSDSFQGRTDAIRMNITLPANDIKSLQKTFRTKILEILAKELPHVIDSKKEINKKLNDKYPHLSGYFEEETIGISSQNNIIKEAQNKFFAAQREILNKSNLSDEELKKSIDLSGRALTEYIVFRQLMIDKLKSINKKDLEATIHNIIVPQRKVLRSENRIENVYQNCSWILDEKFMTYSTVLSEMEMSNLITEIIKEDVERDDDRPDIAIIFSDDPKTVKKVDVVIVELKKKGLKPEENVKVEVQLEKRARKLFDIYPDKIQRLWLYGVTELDDEYKSHLSTAGYHPLYSKGTIFVNTTDITVSWKSGIKIPAARYVMDFDALVDDANARNKTFLDIIKGKLDK